ncbi:tyrosine-type recombinase/integrase [Brevundimonas sp. TWP2-3-4b2]|uniref:tyrosine-type recombinase/integrase n=1 Tax=Brevundimonas sp. TWP2-3-4b2 TaxID=2804595 RepID=UPI003CFAECFB
MRVRLKGINRISKRLADGSTVTYHYAWKGGPRLNGKPGSPEFIASYNEAVNARKLTPEGTMRSILDAYESSSDFKSLADRTRADYKKHLRAIAGEFGDFPLAALNDRRSRGEFLAWRDRLATTSRRGADYRFAVFARALSWAFNRGLTAINPLERPGRLYRANRNDAIWTDSDEAAFLAKAPAHLHLALTLALWTGQRQGDLLRLTWTAYDGQSIRLKQRKTGARVALPVGAPLKAALDTAKVSKKDAVTILTTEAGTSWTESGFRASWRKACVKAGVSDVTFHDLRGTAVTRLALAGCIEAEIATITGHSLRDVGSILDSHYLKRDGGLAESAIRKLETRTKTPN